MSQSLISRRNFLGLAGITSFGALLAGCQAVDPVAARTGAAVVATPVNTPVATGHEGMDHASDAVSNMDAMHEKGIKAFPAKTAGLGGQPLAFEMDGDIKVFKLICKDAMWEVEPGKLIKSMTYNG